MTDLESYRSGACERVRKKAWLQKTVNCDCESLPLSDCTWFECSGVSKGTVKAAFGFAADAATFRIGQKEIELYRCETVLKHVKWRTEHFQCQKQGG